MSDVQIDVMSIDGGVRHKHWTIEFSDERDFCRFASQLIGAVYVSGPDALKRFEKSSLWGTRIFGNVRASGPNSN